MNTIGKGKTIHGDEIFFEKIFTPIVPYFQKEGRGRAEFLSAGRGRAEPTAASGHTMERGGNGMKNLWVRVRLSWGRLHLADRLLLAFMAVLLIQSGHNLFAHELGQGQSAELDVVVRTTMAAVFGYFISAGMRGGEESAPSAAQPPIGFALPQEEKTSLRMEGEGASSGSAQKLPQPGGGQGEPPGRLGQQMVMVGLMGLASLGLLILARNCGQTSPEALATLSQLRDFVSGSVGFLIAHSGRKDL